MQKRGLSAVVTTMIMIGMVLAAAVIVWGIVKTIIEEKIDESEACFGIFERIVINNEYTCYDSNTNEIQISIDVEDIEIDKLLVSVSDVGQSLSFEIYEGAQYDYVKYLSGSYNEIITLPEQSAGLTYVAKIDWEPEIIQIAPIINEKSCGTSDTLNNIDSCSLLS